jgi:hypothetical protein
VLNADGNNIDLLRRVLYFDPMTYLPLDILTKPTDLVARACGFASPQSAHR